MSRKRENSKQQSRQEHSDNGQLVAARPTVPKEKLLLESGKFCLDIAKLVFGGVVLAGIMKRPMDVVLLFPIGLVVVLIFLGLGLYIINKLN